MLMQALEVESPIATKWFVNNILSSTVCFLSASWEAQIEIEIPASGSDKEYSQYINQWYSLENVNIYILFIYS